MSRKPRLGQPVYIDPSTDRTAKDISSPEHCRALIKRIERNLEEISRIDRNLTRREQSARYYKKRALVELSSRLTELEGSD